MNEARSIANGPIGYLKDTFGDISFGEYLGITTCAIPCLYNLTGKRRLLSTFQRNAPHHRFVLSFNALQGHGLSREESAMDLAKKILSADQPVIHADKPGQKKHLPTIGLEYMCIVNSDPQHSHDNPDLIDLIDIRIDPIGNIIIDEDLGMQHMHVIPKGLF